MESNFPLILIPFLFVAFILIVVWVVCAYWQIKLIKRIQVVSRELYSIPENVYFGERARKARQIDNVCKDLYRKRNTWFIIFFSLLPFSVLLWATLHLL